MLVTLVRHPAIPSCPSHGAQCARDRLRSPATALPGIGLLHVDPTSLVAAPAGITASTGLCSFGFALPPQPALAGLEVYWQGAIVVGNNLHLTGLLIDRLLW